MRFFFSWYRGWNFVFLNLFGKAIFWLLGFTLDKSLFLNLNLFALLGLYPIQVRCWKVTIWKWNILCLCINWPWFQLILLLKVFLSLNSYDWFLLIIQLLISLCSPWYFICVWAFFKVHWPHLASTFGLLWIIFNARNAYGLTELLIESLNLHGLFKFHNLNVRHDALLINPLIEILAVIIHFLKVILIIKRISFTHILSVLLALMRKKSLTLLNLSSLDRSLHWVLFMEWRMGIWLITIKRIPFQVAQLEVICALL